MQLRGKVLFFLCLIGPASAASFTYQVAGNEPGSWPKILSSIGLKAGTAGSGDVSVVRNVTAGAVPAWLQKVDAGGVIVIEGDTPLANAIGIKATDKHLGVRSIIDQRAP